MIKDFVNAVINKENAAKLVSSSWEGIKAFPMQSYNYLSNPSNDRYNNIAYVAGNSIIFWATAGFYNGSIASILVNGSGLTISKIHSWLMTPPESRK